MHARPARRRLITPAAIVVIVAHVLSRLGYHLLGVRFLWGHASVYHHFVDAEVLRADLWRSLWYDHAQPPGLNLLWGLSLRIGGDHPDRVLLPFFLLIGVGVALALLVLARRLGLGERTATIVATLWTISPVAVLMERYLMYTPLEVLGLLTTALALGRWTRDGRVADAALTAGIGTALVLTRASFHPIWLIGLVVLLAVARPDRRRGIAVAATITLVLAGGWSLKNLVLFGQPGTTSWAGANLNRITTEQLPLEEREALVERGELSPYALHPAFSTFEDMGLPPTERRDPAVSAPVLDELSRRAQPRFGSVHHRDYLDVNAARMDDALWVIRHRPGAYLRGISRSLSLTFRSGSDWFGYGPNTESISAIVTAERLVTGGVGEMARPGDPDLGSWELANHQWLLMAGYALVLVAVPLRLRAGRAWRSPDPETVMIAFLWGSTVFLFTAGVLVEFGENNRFRSVLDPVVALMGCWWIQNRRAVRPVTYDTAPEPDPAPTVQPR